MKMSPSVLRQRLLSFLIGLLSQDFAGGMNLPPFFREDLNNLVIPENTPVGTPVFTLIGVDPEKSELRYGIMGTDKLTVDERTGVVTIAKLMDREIEDKLRISVTVEDMDAGNVVPVKNVIQIADVNDNPVTFVNKSSYESVEILEDTRVGSRILFITLEDPDLTGLELSLNCTPILQSPEACQIFPIEIREATSGILKSEIKLGEKLDYNQRSWYQFILTASDGEHISTAEVLIRVKDVQNTPPVFVGAMSGRVMEDSPVGTLVMVIEARDGDLGQPRNIRLTIVTNPGDSFQLDSKTGHLITTRPLDRETLGSLLQLEVKAQELPRDEEVVSTRRAVGLDILQTIANVTILIDDVNDFAPKFNQKEFWTEINENTPIGTPLPDLDIFVSDEDSGTFADFTLRIDGPLAELFDIEPKIVSGSTRPVIRLKKAFDYENPNERKFLILVIAQNMEDPEPFSTCTISVSTIDVNDNRPNFLQDVYTISVSESAKPGTKISTITASDPDSKEFGNEGLVYQLVGAGNKKFSVNPKTGEISVAECPNASDNHTITVTSCLDYEAQRTYDLLYMASDSHKMDGFIHSIVPLQIILSDSNDNQLYFDTKFHRTILENSHHFEPRFFIRAMDIDKTSLIAYNLQTQGTNAGKYFQIDETTAELTIKSLVLPPENYTFHVSANDGVFTAITPVLVTVVDINNNNPVFKSSLKRNLNISEDSEIGSLLVRLEATDSDFGDNGKVLYKIESGSHEFFDIDEDTGDIFLSSELDDTIRPEFNLAVSAFDLGNPSLRTTTLLHVQVLNVYTPLPEIFPKLQRAQVSESANLGDVITQITTKTGKVNFDEELQLNYEFVLPMEARNLDNKAVPDHEVFKDWFRINNSGEVSVSTELAREIITAVNLTVLLTSPMSRPGLKSYGTLAITIFDVNIFPPRVEDVEIETYEELPPGMSILTLTCEDPEGGQISNYFIGEGSEFVSIDNKTGEIKVRGRLDYEDHPIYNLTVVCVDSGLPPLSSTGTVMISLLNINDNPPVFNQTFYSAEIDEHAPEGTILTSVFATDADGDVIYYDIESGKYSAAFRIDRLGQITMTKEGSTLLDREIMPSPFVTLGIRAKDAEHLGFTTVQVKVNDVNDVWPKIMGKNYHATVYAPLHSIQEIVKVRAHGGDADDTDDMQFKIYSGNELGVFDIEAKTGVVRASRAYEESKEFRLTVEVTDRKGDTSGEDHYDRTEVIIQILPGNFRKPEFKFPNRVNSTLPTVESNSAEVRKFLEGNYTKVLGQLSAFDQDEGDVGEIQFYFKEGQNLVTDTNEFRIESETGKIYQIRPLDREQMNRYNLVVVAKDKGEPVSTETHEVLNIIVEDIDDNSPKFGEIRSYNFSIKENSLANTFTGQVEANDEDEGRNAQIFYFLVATEENHHYIHHDFRVDIKSGSIYSNAVLDHERINSYLFFVRASSSPMANKSAELMKLSDILDEPSVAIVRVQILDLNDNSPRFQFREYFAGINSNAEPGREILTFESTDVDPSSQPFIQYSLLGSHLILDDVNAGGAVLPSPFRVDGNTGRLTLSPTAMRRYAGGNNKFLVKVGVKETIPPYYQDTTQVRVWVVEDSQEAIVTIKTPPTEMIQDDLIELLGNITEKLILINKVTPHVNEDRSVNKQWSDVYVTAIDKKSNQILPVPEFLQTLDLGHDQLRKSGVAIELFSAVPAMGSTEVDGNFFFNDRESFDTAFAGLVALVALLCMGLATILAVCCCVNRMYSASVKGSEMSSGMKYPLHPGGSLPGTPVISRNILKQQPEMIEDLATDNPLWIDHKIKTYEEQELTMQVASDLDNSTGTGDGGSVDGDHGHGAHPPGHHREIEPPSSPQCSHSYATIHHHPPPDYDNILGDDTMAVHL